MAAFTSSSTVVAVDAALLDQADFRVRFLRRLMLLATPVQFALVTRPSNASLFADIDLPNVLRLEVPEPGRLDRVLASLDARLPAQRRRQRLMNRFTWPRAARQAYSRLWPSLPLTSGARVVFHPFTRPAVFEPLVPTVAAVHDLQQLSAPHLLTSRQRAAAANAHRRLMRYSSRIVCSSEAILASTLECRPVSPERLTVVPPGPLLIEASVERDIEARVLAQLGLGAATFWLMPSTGEPRHNVPVVLTAYALFRQRCPDASLKLVCEAPTAVSEKTTQAIVERLGLQSSVLVLNALDTQQHIALMQSAHAVVVASLYETVGEDVLQAMTLGRPVVCSSLPTLVAIADRAALFFDPRRPADLAAKLEQIVMQDGLAGRLGLQGRERVQTIDDAETTAEAFVRVFRETRCPQRSR